MSLHHGPHVLAIPGPSMFPTRVLNAMNRGAPNIYEGPIVELTDRIKRDLLEVARMPNGEALIYICNGHGGWEASISNLANPGDRFLALNTGRFTLGWVEVARKLGAEVEVMDFGTDRPIDANRVEERLRADTERSFKGVMAVHVDTASSVKNDVPAIRAALDAAGHPALLMIDCIASLACDPFETEAWGVDVMVAGCQKGLMTPPGLAFNFVGERALAARRQARHVSGYWDWEPRANAEHYYMNFYGTAPTNHLFGLAEALEMILRDEGLEAVWRRHATLAETVWTAIEHWGPPLRCNIADRAHRSTAVTAIVTGEGQAEAIRTWAETRANVTLGLGLGLGTMRLTPGLFRIGHMGHLSAHGILGTLGVVEAAMTATGVPHNKGALAAAAEVIARGA